MDDNALQQIVTAINKLRCDVHAQRLILQVAVGQIAGSSTDWRERLTVMRTNTERAVQRFRFLDGDPNANKELREQMLRYAQEVLSEVHNGLVDWEKQGRPSQ